MKHRCECVIETSRNPNRERLEADPKCEKCDGTGEAQEPRNARVAQPLRDILNKFSPGVPR